MKSFVRSVDQAHMEYQKRLKFIEYIKKNFIENDLDCGVYKTFIFESYEDFASIRVLIFTDVESSLRYYRKHCYEDNGVCQFAHSIDGVPYLIFEDEFMIYQYNLLQNEYDINDLKVGFRSDSQTIQQQLNSLIRRLNGEQSPQRIYNC